MDARVHVPMLLCTESGIRCSGRLFGRKTMGLVIVFRDDSLNYVMVFRPVRRSERTPF